VGAQIFDGFAAGAFMVVSVLIVADCTEGIGHYNLALGSIGAAVGIGSSISTAMAGLISQRWGFGPGFLTLAASGLASCLLFAWMMPETRVRQPVSVNELPRAA
jgi:MFS family permease